MADSRNHVLELYKHCRELEKNFDKLTDADLSKLKKSLQDLERLPGLHLDKLADLAKHIQPGMTLKHFQNLIVPLERWLRRAIRDDEFLVRTDDVPKERAHYPLILVLDHLRSAFNVGAFFRLADGLGVEKIILTGYTPTPEQTSVQKTSLGSEDSVPWEYVPDLVSFLERHKDTHQIIAWETADKSIPCESPFAQKPTIFIFGNERFGVEKDRLLLCHEIREIKMLGHKNSLNVAQSASIGVFEWRRQWLISSR